MTKALKSKLFLGVLCLILAAAIAFLILPGLYASKADTAQAVKLSQDVPVGTVITADMLSTVEVGSFGLPTSVIQKEEDAIGKVAADKLYTGEYLTASRLSTADEYKQLIKEQTKGLTRGLCLVTIEFPSASSGIAGVLRSGHIVDVYECVENEDRSYSVAKVLESMQVYDVLNDKLESLSELDRKKADALIEDDTDYDFEPAFVTFRCSEAQAQTMIRLERMGALHLTLQRTEG